MQGKAEVGVTRQKPATPPIAGKEPEAPRGTEPTPPHDPQEEPALLTP